MRTSMVNAEPSRSHVRQLVADGMRQSDICRAAHITGAALQILLHGHYNLGRTQQETIHVTTETRLLAVRFEARPAKQDQQDPLCAADGRRYEPTGYKVGRCLDCGQLAPLRRRYDHVTLIGHPRPADSRRAA